MSYITHGMAGSALRKMHTFHSSLVALYSDHGMDLLDDLGRRNILMSRLQEKCFAEELANKYPLTFSDGRTGLPDIVVPDLDCELECKLTSKHKSGAWSLQTDFETLQKKGELDYLYVLADRTFSEFAVLHFKDLTVDDFRSLSPGARGKVAMYKHRAMDRCTVLHGAVINVKDAHLEKICNMLKSNLTPAKAKELKKRAAYWSNSNASYSFLLEKI